MSKFPDSLGSGSVRGQTHMAPGSANGAATSRPAVSRTAGDSNHHRTWDEVLEQGEQLMSDDKAGFAFTWSEYSMFTIIHGSCSGHHTGSDATVLLSSWKLLLTGSSAGCRCEAPMREM